LLSAALEAAARVADGLHVARAELSVTDVLKRLEREVEKLLRNQADSSLGTSG
jgi:hypothetical protein